MNIERPEDSGTVVVLGPTAEDITLDEVALLVPQAIRGAEKGPVVWLSFPSRTGDLKQAWNAIKATLLVFSAHRGFANAGVHTTPQGQMSVFIGYHRGDFLGFEPR